MNILKRVTPTNLLEEKAKFFEDETYNPQFKYTEKVDASILSRYGKPSRQINDLAQTILDRAYYHKNSTELENELGPLVSQAKATTKIKQFLKMHHLEKRYELIWSKSFVARTSITAKTIKLRLPSTYRHQSLIGVIYHEIGTHAIRRVNYEQQPWFNKKSEYGFANYLPTEEGLAVLHGLLPLKNQLAFKPALSYVAATYAQNHSFVELWNFLKKYIDDPEKRWITTLRQKRGLTNTAQVGGFTKDLVYFSGMKQVWQYLNKNDYQIDKLYIGKVALENLDQAWRMNPNFSPLLPSFYQVKPSEYQLNVKRIGKINLFI